LKNRALLAILSLYARVLAPRQDVQLAQDASARSARWFEDTPCFGGSADRNPIQNNL
jgi:hypothetical protein